jgi:membrane-associated phospholipid phosphatase
MVSIAALAGAVYGTPPAVAQETARGSSLGDAPADAWFLVRSPLETSTSDAATLGIALLGAGAALLADEPIHDWVRTDPLPVRLLAPFRDTGPLGSMGRSAQFLLPASVSLWAVGHLVDSPDLRDAGIGCVTANLTTTLTRTLITNLIGRPRPAEDQGAFRFQLFAFGDWEQRSFFGGHASNVMSCASFFNHRFDLGAAAPVVWAVATAVGVGRIADAAHWTSDTYTGMVYGYAIGRNVARRHLDRRGYSEGERSMQPGVQIGWQLRF